MCTGNHRGRRAGTVLVFTLFMMVAVIAMLAFAVDLGYVFVVRSELQRSADAAALAAAWELCDEISFGANSDPMEAAELARYAAGDYASLNTVGGANPAMAYQDVNVGYLQSDGKTVSLVPSSLVAVQAQVRRTADQNGEVPLFFSRVLGINGSPGQAQATAVFVSNISGFGTPSSGENLDIMPFALDPETWDDLIAGIGSDDWTWNEELQEVTSGPDGILEVNLYPQGTGSPGNRGTVDIGSNNNSTSDLARQITEGISAEDLDFHGGELVLDENGELSLNADTGISAGVKDELTQIKGQPKITGIFSQLSGNGNNAQYTIVHFAGIRIMDVKLTGKMSSKRVIIQPAKIAVRGGIRATGVTQTSSFVYSPVWLIR